MSEENTQTTNEADITQHLEPKDERKFTEKQLQSVIKNVRNEERAKYERRQKENQDSGFNEDSYTPSPASSAKDFDQVISKAAERAIQHAREQDRLAQQEKDKEERETRFQNFQNLFVERLDEACRDKTFKEALSENPSVASKANLAVLAMEKPDDIQNFKKVMEWLSKNPDDAEEINIIADSDYQRARKKLKKLMGSNESSPTTSSDTQSRSRSTPPPLDQYTPSTTSKGGHPTTASALKDFYKKHR